MGRYCFSLFFLLVFVPNIWATSCQLTINELSFSNENPYISWQEFAPNSRLCVFESTMEERIEFIHGILDLNDDITLVLKDTLTDKQGGFHEFFKEYYKGFEVEGAIACIHYNKHGLAISISGSLINLPDLEKNVYISENEARRSVKNYYESVTDTDLRILNICRIVVFIEQNVPRFAYQIEIESSNGCVHTENFVDIETGKILKSRNLNCNLLSRVATIYSGEVDIVTEFSGSNYYLIDYTRGDGIITREWNGTIYSSSQNFTDTNSFDKASHDAHWGAEMSYDFFLESFGRNSLDNHGGCVVCEVNKPYTEGAFWNDSTIVFGRNILGPWVCLDIVAHEFTHGVTAYSSNLIYEGESGAINEALSDIFATCVENFAKPGRGYKIWQCAEDIVLNSGLRDMGNPLCKYYNGVNWIPTDNLNNDYGGVHDNSGVFNYWFFLLVNGGSGTNEAGYEYSVTGIGLDDAIQICYLLNTAYLYPSANFTAARHLSVAAAQQLGYNSHVLHQIEEAWNAVGVPAMTIIGNSVLGQITTFSIENLQEGANVSWSVVGSIPSGYTLQEDVPAVNQCMITRTGYSEFKSITLQATVSKNDTTVATLKKIVRRDSFAGTYKEVMRTNTFPPTMYTAIHPTTITNRNAIDVYPNGTVMLTSPYFTGKSISYQGGTPLYFSHSSNQVLFRIGAVYVNSPFTIVVSENGDDAEVRLHFYTLHPIFGLSILPIAERQFNISIDNDDMRINETESFSSDELTILNQAFAGMLPEQNQSMTDDGWVLDVYDSEKGAHIMKKEIFESSYLLDAETWPSGLYVIKATIGSETFTGKIRIDT